MACRIVSIEETPNRHGIIAFYASKESADKFFSKLLEETGAELELEFFEFGRAIPSHYKISLTKGLRKDLVALQKIAKDVAIDMDVEIRYGFSFIKQPVRPCTPGSKSRRAKKKYMKKRVKLKKSKRAMVKKVKKSRSKPVKKDDKEWGDYLDSMSSNEKYLMNFRGF